MPRGLEVNDFMAPDPALLSKSEIELDAAPPAPGVAVLVAPPIAVGSTGAVTPEGAAIEAAPPPALGAPPELTPGTADVPVSNTEPPPPILALAFATFGDSPALGLMEVAPPKAVGDGVMAAALNPDAPGAPMNASAVPNAVAPPPPKSPAISAPPAKAVPSKPVAPPNNPAPDPTI